MSFEQLVVTLVVFAAVILLIAFNLLDLVVAGLMGVSALMVLDIIGQEEILSAARTGGGALSLLFGGMVVARTLRSTGLFERFGERFLKATGGSGRRFLLLLVIVVLPLCALLPNAITVIMLAPIVIRVSQALEVDFIGPMVLTAILSNSAGLLTLVGDPATFLVGNACAMSFVGYLKQVSLGGLLASLVVVPLFPWLMADLWRTRHALPKERKREAIRHKGFAIAALTVMVLMVATFIFGEFFPHPIVPPAAAIAAASLALLAVYCYKVEPIDEVLRDIDFKSILFIACSLILVEAISKTGLLQSLSLKMYAWFGAELTIVALVLLGGIGFLSGLLANIPVVAASVMAVKGYLVAAAVMPETALMEGYAQWPTATLPVFVAMMFGATLGGNATVIGASANVVAAGICTANGRALSFGRFMRYGLPMAAAQIVVSALYVLGMTWLRGG